MSELRTTARPDRMLALIFIIFCSSGLLLSAHFLSLSSSIAPQVLTGRFTGLSLDGQSFSFQPTGSSTGTSYAWSGDTMWIDTGGTVHLSGPAACVKSSDRGRAMTIGVVTTRPVGSAPGTKLLAHVKC